MSSSDTSLLNSTSSLETADAINWENNRLNQILSTEELSVLNVRSNYKGLVQLAGHLTVMVVTGYLWANYANYLLLAIPALIVYGVSLATMFAPMHECVHRTAFANHRLNDIVAWLASLLSFYNSTFYPTFRRCGLNFLELVKKGNL